MKKFPDECPCLGKHRPGHFLGKLLYVPKMNENHDIIGDYDAVPLEYAGFCPVALVSGQGFILPGNRRIGFLRFEGMLKKHTLIWKITYA